MSSGNERNILIPSRTEYEMYMAVFAKLMAHLPLTFLIARWPQLSS